MSRKTVMWTKKYTQGLRVRGKEEAWRGLLPDRRVRSTGRCSLKKITDSGEVMLLPGVDTGKVGTEAMRPEKGARIHKRVGPR